MWQAAHPSFHELANLSGSFNDYTRHPNPVIHSIMIKDNLGWRNIGEDCNQYLKEQMKIAIGEKLVFICQFCFLYIMSLNL